MPIIGQRNHPKLSKAAGRDFQAVLVEIDPEPPLANSFHHPQKQPFNTL